MIRLKHFENNQYNLLLKIKYGNLYSYYSQHDLDNNLWVIVRSLNNNIDNISRYYVWTYVFKSEEEAWKSALKQ